MIVVCANADIGLRPPCLHAIILLLNEHMNANLPKNEDKIEYLRSSMPASKMSRRVRFIAAVNRSLERVLHVAPEEEVVNLPPTPEELLLIEAGNVQQQRLQVLRRVLFAIPSGVARRMLQHHTVLEIRELLRNVRLEDIPRELLDILNNLEFL